MRISYEVMENGGPDFGHPSWMPPDDMLAATVPVGQFLVRTERMIVALSHVSVYPNGCMLDVRASARGGDVPFDVFERIVFSARFGAGTTAAMNDNDPYRWPSQGQDVLALKLMLYGQDGSSTDLSGEDRRADCTLWLWLHPLPPPEPGTLSIVSPYLGSEPASCPLDGQAIVAAGTAAQPYWR